MSFKVIYDQGCVTATFEVRTNIASNWERARIGKFIDLCNSVWDECEGDCPTSGTAEPNGWTIHREPVAPVDYDGEKK